MLTEVSFIYKTIVFFIVNIVKKSASNVYGGGNVRNVFKDTHAAVLR